jgi:uncharacterized protein
LEGVRPLLGALLEALPLVALALIAQWGRQERDRRRIVIGLMTFSSMVVFGIGILVFIGGLFSSFLGNKGGGEVISMSLWLLAGGTLSGLALIPTFRRLLRWVMPGDLESTAQIVGLWVFLFGLTFFLGIGSSFHILEWLTALPEEQLATAMEMDPKTVLAGGIAFPLIALFGAGFPLKRNMTEVLYRLKLGKVKSKHWVWIFSFVGIGLGLDALFSVLSQWIPGWGDQGIQKILDQMAGGQQSTWTEVLVVALAVGISAGIGEELLFRGLLQPRFGNFLTSIFFASLHLQYGFTPVLIQLVVWSMVLGFVKNKTNTTVVILAHGLYDFIAVLLSGLG